MIKQIKSPLFAAFLAIATLTTTPARAEDPADQQPAADPSVCEITLPDFLSHQVATESVSALISQMHSQLFAAQHHGELLTVLQELTKAVTEPGFYLPPPIRKLGLQNEQEILAASTQPCKKDFQKSLYFLLNTDAASLSPTPPGRTLSPSDPQLIPSVTG